MNNPNKARFELTLIIMMVIPWFLSPETMHRIALIYLIAAILIFIGLFLCWAKE